METVSSTVRWTTNHPIIEILAAARHYIDFVDCQFILQKCFGPTHSPNLLLLPPIGPLPRVFAYQSLGCYSCRARQRAVP